MDHTLITYTLPSEEDVTLDIYDVSGRKVMMLLQHVRQPAGMHQVRLQRGNLRGGLYLCQLKLGESVKTLKLLVAR